MSVKRERSDEFGNIGNADKRLHYSADDAAIHQAQICIETATAMYENLLRNRDVTTVQLQNAGVAVEAARAYRNKLKKSFQLRVPSPYFG